MDKDEAAKLLAKEFLRYEAMTYAELKALVGEIDAYEVSAASGNSYQVEFEVFWSGKPDSDLCVSGAIDDGGFWAAFAPVCQSFFKAPDGSILPNRGN